MLGHSSVVPLPAISSPRGTYRGGLAAPDVSYKQDTSHLTVGGAPLSWQQGYVSSRHRTEQVLVHPILGQPSSKTATVAAMSSPSAEPNNSLGLAAATITPEILEAAATLREQILADARTVDRDPSALPTSLLPEAIHVRAPHNPVTRESGRVAFPSQRPTSRAEVMLLVDAYALMMAQAQSQIAASAADAANGTVAATGVRTTSSSIGGANLVHLHLAELGVLDAVWMEIIRHDLVVCSERGALLESVRQNLFRRVNGILESVSELQEVIRQRDEEIQSLKVTLAGMDAKVEAEADKAIQLRLALRRKEKLEATEIANRARFAAQMPIAGLTDSESSLEFRKFAVQLRDTTDKLELKRHNDDLLKQLEIALNARRALEMRPRSVAATDTHELDEDEKRRRQAEEEVRWQERLELERDLWESFHRSEVDALNKTIAAQRTLLEEMKANESSQRRTPAPPPPLHPAPPVLGSEPSSPSLLTRKASNVDPGVLTSRKSMVFFGALTKASNVQPSALGRKVSTVFGLGLGHRRGGGQTMDDEAQTDPFVPDERKSEGTDAEVDMTIDEDSPSAKEEARWQELASKMERMSEQLAWFQERSENVWPQWTEETVDALLEVYKARVDFIMASVAETVKQSMLLQQQDSDVGDAGSSSKTTNGRRRESRGESLAPDDAAALTTFLSTMQLANHSAAAPKGNTAPSGVVSRGPTVAQEALRVAGGASVKGRPKSLKWLLTTIDDILHAMKIAEGTTGITEISDPSAGALRFFFQKYGAPPVSDQHVVDFVQNLKLYATKDQPHPSTPAPHGATLAQRMSDMKPQRVWIMGIICEVLPLFSEAFASPATPAAFAEVRTAQSSQPSSLSLQDASSSTSTHFCSPHFLSWYGHVQFIYAALKNIMPRAMIKAWEVGRITLPRSSLHAAIWAIYGKKLATSLSSSSTVAAPTTAVAGGATTTSTTTVTMESPIVALLTLWADIAMTNYVMGHPAPLLNDDMTAVVDAETKAVLTTNHGAPQHQGVSAQHPHHRRASVGAGTTTAVVVVHTADVWDPDVLMAVTTERFTSVICRVLFPQASGAGGGDAQGATGASSAHAIIQW